ncbi:MAG: hypothetical protein DSY90_14180 [Deltaproteobacteria bacterium]|nr:MAG: hypothetical protein DSY90_14180 [Deltaproteobacteria bacterium]
MTGSSCFSLDRQGVTPCGNTGNHLSMARSNRKRSRNAPGKYYADDQCIGCALCAAMAPAHFRENLNGDARVDSAYAWCQRRTLTETYLCRETMQNCPAAAIGNAGLTPGALS